MIFFFFLEQDRDLTTEGMYVYLDDVRTPGRRRAAVADRNNPACRIAGVIHRRHYLSGVDCSVPLNPRGLSPPLAIPVIRDNGKLVIVFFLQFFFVSPSYCFYSNCRVSCIKHIFESFVVLQFDVSNGLSDQRLHNVVVKVECRSVIFSEQGFPNFRLACVPVGFCW